MSADRIEVGAHPVRQFLVERHIDRGLVSVHVFDDDRKALRAYEKAERRLMAQAERRMQRMGGLREPSGTVCLFGADRLGTLLKTHAGWFDEPVDEDLFRQVAAMAAAGASRDQHDTEGRG